MQPQAAEPENSREKGGEAWNIFVFEFLGTSLFIYGSATSQKSEYNVGLCYFGVLALFGRLCGGHFNPAVTLSLLFQGQIDLPKFFNYIIAQFVGAFFAAFLVFLYIDMNHVPYYQQHPLDQLFATMVGEVLGATLFFLFVQIQLIKDTQITANPIASFIFLTGVFFAAREFTIVTSKSLFNPAGALALTIFQCLKRADWKQIDNLWVFLAGPFGASVLAAFLYAKVYVPSKRR